MRRRKAHALVLAVRVLLALVPASVASADAPTRAYSPNANFTVPAGYCGFPVTVEWLVNREYVKTLVPTDGGSVTQILKLNGALVGRLTNAQTGISLVQNFSGPVTGISYADGSFRTSGPSRRTYVEVTHERHTSQIAREPRDHRSAAFRYIGRYGRAS